MLVSTVKANPAIRGCSRLEPKGRQNTKKTELFPAPAPKARRLACCGSVQGLPGVESNAGSAGTRPEHQPQQDTQRKIEWFVGPDGSEGGHRPINYFDLEGAEVVTVLVGLDDFLGDPCG